MRGGGYRIPNRKLLGIGYTLDSASIGVGRWRRQAETGDEASIVTASREKENRRTRC